MEALWLAAVVLVPIAFLDRDFVLTEAVIGYFEVPKIALLRTLAALMAILWLVEWAFQGRLPLSSAVRGEHLLLRPGAWVRGLRDWLYAEPTRWVILAVAFFLGSTLLSTVLSASRSVSIWGEVPGQDGYSAYTIIAYMVIFGVVASRLKTKSRKTR